MRAVSIALLLAMSTAAASASDRITTLAKGSYACGVPGDVRSAAWVRDPDYAFSIRSASRYRTARGEGTYLLTGKDLVFTRGPLKDMRFRIDDANVLRKTGGHGDPRLFCARIGA